MKKVEGVDERLARIGRATAGIVAPPSLQARILDAIAAREGAVGGWWDAAGSWSRKAVLAALCACAASVALAIHYDATLVTTLATTQGGGIDLAMGEP